MLKNNLILISLMSMFLMSCTSSTYHFYSPNKDQCISIITEKNIRYIMSGFYNEVPDTNYVKLDLSRIDHSTGDEIVGCWNREGNKWIIMMDKAIVLENKLDSRNYKFKEHFPLNNDSIPTLEGYTGKDCFRLWFEYRNLTKIIGSIVK